MSSFSKIIRTTTSRLAIALAVFVVSFGALPPVVAHASIPGQNGRVVYDKGLLGQNGNIFSIAANGTDERQLTFFDTSRHHAGEPSVSADSSKIVFTLSDNGQYFLYLMDADGSNVHMIPGSQDFGSPSFSPDGTKIICISGVTIGINKIYTMNLDGSEKVRLTPNTGSITDRFPQYSPDGTKIVFSSYRNSGPASPGGILVMNSNGSNVQLLTPGEGDNTGPQFTPDGKKIVYKGQDGIKIMNADGSDNHLISPLNQEVQDTPAVSPDGTKIVYSAVAGVFPNPDGALYQINHFWMMNIDGSNPVELTTHVDAETHNPVWTSLPQAELHIVSDNKTRYVGDPDPTFTYHYEGFIDGDTEADLQGSPICVTNAAPDSPAGSYLIGCYNVSSNKYNITSIYGTYTILNPPVSLTVTAQNQTRIYGGSNPSLTADYSGFIDGDTVASLAQPATCTTTATATSLTGSYPITCSGVESTKYEATYVAGTLTVTKAPLTISPDNKTKAFGSTNPGLTISYTEFVNGESAEVLNQAATCTTTATTTSHPGSYPITCSGATSDRYTLTYGSGSLTINKAATKLSLNTGFLGIGSFAILQRQDDSSALAGQTITFKNNLGQTVCTAVTNTTGKAQCSGLALGVTHASYSGNLDYLGSSQ